MSFLSKLFGGDATEKAAKKNAAALQGLQTRGTGYIDTGTDDARENLSKVPGLYEPYAASGANARGVLDNALGLNGAEGNAAATEAFQAGPGYQFAVDESLRAAERGAAASGMLASGNLLAELQNRGNQLANQEYGSWLDRLYQTAGQGLQAAGGQATGYTNLAGLDIEEMANRLGLDASVVAGLNANRNNAAAAKEQGVNNMVGLGQKFLGFLGA